MPNKIEQFFFNNQGNFSGFTKDYFAYLGELFAHLDLAVVENIADVLLRARMNERTIFLIGNGGSAATASHFAEDLARCAGGTEKKPFRAIALTDSVPYLSALGNDEGFEYVFVGQLRNLFTAGDVLVAISASGNSPNIVRAVDFANAYSGTTIGLTGFDGGQLRLRSQRCIWIKTSAGEYGPVEALHLVLIHVITNYLALLLNGR